jgi:2-iminoacetate synthase
MSAGSQTEPGGYTGAGHDDLHLTVKGKRVEIAESDKTPCQKATEQFTIDDTRSPASIAHLIQTQGYEPVWKDWDEAILQH